VHADEPVPEETTPRDIAGEPTEPTEPDESAAAAAPAEHPVRIGTGVMPAVVTGLVLAAAVITFVAQNLDRVDMEWLWFDFRTTPGVLMLVSLFLGVLAAVVVGVIVRRNRRIRLNEREELRRLRTGATDAPRKS
jgi:uncharacterized integral membrane protein